MDSSSNRSELLKKGVAVGAAVSVVTELSARSIASGGEPQKFPDFTHGMWKTKRALHVTEDGA